MPKTAAQPVIRVNLQLPPALYDELRRLAAEDGQTMTAYIVRALTVHVPTRTGRAPKKV